MFSLVDLASSLTVENLQAMLADPETVRELQKHLPAMGESGAATESEQLRSTLQSPQFQQVELIFEKPKILQHYFVFYLDVNTNFVP